MPADQVEIDVLEDGSVVYLYRVGADVAVIAAENVLHLKEMGNGTIGLARLDYMKATTAEAANSQTAANKLFSTGGKPTGVLMIDKVLSKDQRERVQANFNEMANGSTSRLFVLEANMKYEQVNLTPQDMELLSTRQMGVQEIGRWFGVPSILINQTEGTTTLGSSSGEIIESFYKLVIRPALVSIEQAMRKRIMTSAQRVKYTIEFSFDALLRSNIKDRMEVYSQAVQNGIKTRNECRQLENDPPIPGGDELTAQTNLVPIAMLGKVKPAGGVNGTQDAIAQ
jgi:HK97 family phage portal protein